MSASNTLETGLLNLIFKNTDLAAIGDATGLRGSTTAGSLYVSLHTADPGETGTQSTSEATYTGYARVAVARGAGWTVTGNTATNAAAVSFPIATAGTNTITHYSIGVASSGSTAIVFRGALDTPLGVSNGITPQFAASDITISLD